MDLLQNYIHRLEQANANPVPISAPPFSPPAPSEPSTSSSFMDEKKDDDDEWQPRKRNGKKRILPEDARDDDKQEPINPPAIHHDNDAEMDVDQLLEEQDRIAAEFESKIPLPTTPVRGRGRGRGNRGRGRGRGTTERKDRAPREEKRGERSGGGRGGRGGGRGRGRGRGDRKYPEEIDPHEEFRTTFAEPSDYSQAELQSSRKKRTKTARLLGQQSLAEATGSFSGIPRSVVDDSSGPCLDSTRPQFSQSSEDDIPNLQPMQRQIWQAVRNEHNVAIFGTIKSGQDSFMRAMASVLKQRGKKVVFASTTRGAAFYEGAEFIEDVIGMGEFARKETAHSRAELLKRKEYKEIKENLASIDVLVLGNISKLTQKGFDIIERTLSASRNSYAGFGGVQIILYGDIYSGEAWSCEGYFFQSRAWSNFKQIHGQPKDCVVYACDTIDSIPQDPGYTKALQSTRIKGYTSFRRLLEDRCRVSPLLHLVFDGPDENQYMDMIRPTEAYARESKTTKLHELAYELNLDLDLPVWSPIDKKLPPWIPTQICTSYDAVDQVNIMGLALVDNVVCHLHDSRREFPVRSGSIKEDQKCNREPIFYEAEIERTVVEGEAEAEKQLLLLKQAIPVDEKLTLVAGCQVIYVGPTLAAAHVMNVHRGADPNDLGDFSPLLQYGSCGIVIGFQKNAQQLPIVRFFEKQKSFLARKEVDEVLEKKLAQSPAPSSGATTPASPAPSPGASPSMVPEKGFDMDQFDPVEDSIWYLSEPHIIQPCVWDYYGDNHEISVSIKQLPLTLAYGCHLERMTGISFPMVTFFPKTPEGDITGKPILTLSKEEEKVESIQFSRLSDAQTLPSRVKQLLSHPSVSVFAQQRQSWHGRVQDMLSRLAIRCIFRYGEMYEAFSKLDSHVRIWVPEDFDYQCICVSPRCEELMEYLKKSGQLIQ